MRTLKEELRTPHQKHSPYERWPCHNIQVQKKDKQAILQGWALDGKGLGQGDVTKIIMLTKLLEQLNKSAHTPDVVCRSCFVGFPIILCCGKGDFNPKAHCHCPSDWMSWPMIRMHLIGAEDVNTDGYSYTLMAQSCGATERRLRHSSKNVRKPCKDKGKKWREERVLPE